MENEGFWGVVSDLLIKLQAFVERPNVQIQLVAILAILVGMGILSGMVMVALNRRQKSASLLSEPKEEGETGSRRLLRKRMFQSGANLLVFPILALIATYIVIFLFQAQNRFAGLLRLLAFILWMWFAYRSFLLLLYMSFPKNRVRRFDARLFTPLFVLFVIYQIIQLFSNVTALGTVALFADLLENPITLGALFLATVGLYFWVDSILGLNEVIYHAATRFTSLNPGQVEASLTITGYILIAAGIIFALMLLGVDSTTFAAVMAGLSVGIGFGLQEVLSNLVSGILLLFEGSIAPGDWIEIDGERVQIKKLGIRATTVQSNNNIEMVVPNQELLTSITVLYTGTDNSVRLKIPASASYNHEPEEVIPILEEAVRQNPYLVPDRPVIAALTAFGDSQIEYELRVWIDITKIDPPDMRNAVNRAVSQAFIKHEIDMYDPYDDVNLQGDIQVIQAASG